MSWRNVCPPGEVSMWMVPMFLLGPTGSEGQPVSCHIPPGTSLEGPLSGAHPASSSVQ